MKTPTTKLRFDHRHSAGGYRWFVICGVVAVCAGFGGDSWAQSNAAANRQIVHGDQAFKVVQASAYPTAADVKQATGMEQLSAQIQQVGYSSDCSTCGTSCGGTCGPMAGCGSCDGAYGNVGPYGSCGDPCSPCRTYYYGTTEVLYMDHDRSRRFSLSPSFNLDQFDNELGGRVTLGMVEDCVHGYEVGFTGVLQWEANSTLVDVGGNIGTFLTPGTSLVTTDLSAFNDSVILASQSVRADYWSVEANRTFLGWDVAKMLAGLRYIDYRETYNYTSQNSTEVGSLNSDVNNRLIGIHGGLDLLFPISEHGYTDFRSRIGVFANFAESDVIMFNDGTALIANFDDAVELAGVFEIGSGIRYQLGESLSVRFGTELWYLTGVATAGGQFSSVVSPLSTGISTNADSDVVMYGIVAGSELRY